MSNSVLPQIAKDEVCAVTGANGFLGFHIVSQLLEKHIKTIAIIRSEKSSERLQHVFAKHVQSKLLTFAYVPDISQLNEAYTEAFKGVSFVIHTASPIFQLDQKSDTPSRDFYDPAINGALNAVTSAAKHKTVKSVIITGSVVARYHSLTQTNGELRRNSLLPITREEAEKLTVHVLMYRASKSLSEGAIREWVKEHKPHFQTTILIPALLLGPHADPAENILTTGSNSVYRDWIENPARHLDNKANVTAADIRDVAKAHINAALEISTNPHPSDTLHSYFLVERILSAFEALKYTSTVQSVDWDESILDRLNNSNNLPTDTIKVPWNEEDAKTLSVHPLRNTVETFAEFISQSEV